MGVLGLMRVPVGTWCRISVESSVHSKDIGMGRMHQQTTPQRERALVEGLIFVFDMLHKLQIHPSALYVNQDSKHVIYFCCHADIPSHPELFI